MTNSERSAVNDAEAYYDELAEIYPEIATFPIREHATWPATRSLLGDVAGERILDAGCGSGEHSADLAAEGAEVVGVDASAKMLQQARDRHGAGRPSGEPAGSTDNGRSAGDGRPGSGEASSSDDASGSLRFLRADLCEALPFEGGGFDIVCCQLVLSHVQDLGSVLVEFRRVLADGGRLVVATHHPFHDFRVAERERYPRVEVGSTMEVDPSVTADPSPPVYHEDGTVEVEWSEDGLTGTYFRRSLSTLVTALLAAGFDVDGIEEPVPDEAFRKRWPDAYEEFVTRPPEVLCLRGRN